MEGTIVKKKRGRKPKKKQDEPKDEETTCQTNMVIKLTENKDFSNKDSSLLNKGYESQLIGQTNYGEQTTGELCWNCCHEFDTIITGIPMKYDKKIFYTYGDFCSLECCSRYAFEHFKDNFWEILSNINLYNKHIYNNFNPIEMAPSKLVLKRFGGTLDIDNYRKKKNIYEIQLPPILPISHSSNIYEKKNTNQLENLKLYRKKKLPTDKKCITKTMNLTIS